MSDKTHDTKNTLTKRESSRLVDVKGLVEQLPTWALVPSLIVVFCLLLADLAVTDPIPFIDEAALLWALLSGMRVLGARRRAARAAQDELHDLERRQVVADVEAYQVAAPGQPAVAPGQPIAQAS